MARCASLVASLLLAAPVACGPDSGGSPADSPGVTPALAPAAVSAEDASPAPFSGGHWVDLTHPFSSETIYWPTARGFQLDTVSYGISDGGWFYAAFNFSAAEHGGTHLDAPIHFAEGQATADQVSLDHLIGPAAVLDVNPSADPDYLVSVDDLMAFETEHGPLADGTILLLRTGWGPRYGDRLRYLGTELTGPEAVPDLHFPGLAPEAARWLVDRRRIAAVGIDTPSIDYGQSATFDSHVTLYSAGIPGFENVADLESLPPVGSWVFALPMKIQGGSGGPLRIVAWVPDAPDAS